MRNFILLTKFFAGIPPEVLDSLVRTAAEGAERERAHRAPGMLHLLRRARSENSRHAIAVTLDLLESVGKSLGTPRYLGGLNRRVALPLVMVGVPAARIRLGGAHPICSSLSIRRGDRPRRS